MTPEQARTKLDELRQQRIDGKIGQAEYLQHADELAPIAAAAEQVASPKPTKADILKMYLRWAEVDLVIGRRLPAVLVKHLEAYGRRKATFFDRRHAVQIMQKVEDEGFTGEERYIETARRLGRHKTKKPADSHVRLIRSWWETRNEVAEWLDDERLARRRGRPKKKSK